MRAIGQARAGVLERLRARRAEIEQAIFARVSNQWFDRTGSEDPEYVDGLRAAGVAALDYVLVGIERTGESLEPVPVAVLTQARRAARIGVGLETVLRRYVAGYAVLEDFVMREAERGPSLGQTGALREVLQIASALVDRLIAAVSGAYNKEIEQAAAAGAGQDGPASGTSKESDRAKPETCGERGVSRAPVRGMARERILGAIVQVVAERGYARAGVGAVLERARVSSRTLYELFPGGIDDGLLAVMDHGLERVSVLAARALEGEESWREGMRAALAAVLAFFDSEPELARVLVVETLAGDGVVRETRERTVGAFRALVVARIEGEVAHASPLAAHGMLASVMEIVRARLIAPEPQPLIGLLGPLMGLIVEHVAGWETAAEEARRGDELARAIQAQAAAGGSPPPATAGSEIALPAILANPAARRLRECVLYLAEQGERGSHPSNRGVGAAVGVPHKSQVSRLLLQLQAENLAVKRSAGPGAPNEWQLTPHGREIAHALAEIENSPPTGTQSGGWMR